MSIPQHPVAEGLPASSAAYGSGHLVTDFNICFCTSHPSVCDCVPNPSKYTRVEKDLYLHSAQQSAWLLVAKSDKDALTSDDLVVTNIRVQELGMNESGPEVHRTESELIYAESGWEERSCGIWVMRSKYCGNSITGPAPPSYVTDIDILFGADAVDPRPQWGLMAQPLKMPRSEPKLPVAGSKAKMPIRAVPRLTIRHMLSSSTVPQRQGALRAREDGRCKIVQITDTHMVTGVGASRDALDAHGQRLPPSEADPRTVELIGTILDQEKPDLVVLTGDQLHHNIHDSQSALFKVVAPIIERQVPWAAVFGNHDDEGAYALSRDAQMSLLQSLPYNLCQPGPEDVDGVGNYYLSILPHRDHTQSQSRPEVPVATVYCVDSHGEVSSDIKNPDYDWVKQSQIDWFKETSKSLREVRETTIDSDISDQHLSLVFLHIPVPEYGDERLLLRTGRRREPTEGPSHNSHFYDALVHEGVSAVGCGHDHGNDFCGLLPRAESEYQSAGRPDGGGRAAAETQLGPWLCYGGACGYGGYGSYDGVPFYRQSRVWELNTKKGGIKTWRRREYIQERVDELVLVEAGIICNEELIYNDLGSTGEGLGH